jgi:arsenite methyltransferase
VPSLLLRVTRPSYSDAARPAPASKSKSGRSTQTDLEEIPLPEASVDVVISNCVINLAADKRVVLAEAARVLRSGGRFAVSDVIADEGMDEATRTDMAQWTGCIAGALTEAEFRAALAGAGFIDVEIRPTHRVHEHAGSAIVRARKP